MSKPRSAPMPAALRAGRPAPHPARTVRCPHCTAAIGVACTTISGRHRKLHPCPARETLWVLTTACCTTCQVEPGIACHDNGRRREDVHPARYTEAQEMAA
ncbi:hypothetical protein [Streptomyces sp. ISL-94]|uniref:zinc finger domain-containing protein n=1 Tax=Streptomyces sp. ISL-94 TaxID=2819190 RepID=UPI001BE6A291|nr:hypothetical protein [Streptomyces sp. ISL-94]MBT2477604.1 hypothetical protein [Streptomyces sp. ISL-94]